MQVKTFNLILTLLLPVVFAAMSGCAAQLTPATKAAIADAHNQAAIAAEKAKEAQAAAEAAAKAKPASHPIEWLNLIMIQVRGPLIWVGSFSTLIFFGGIGIIIASFFVAALLATTLKAIGLLVAPIAGSVSVGCWGTLFFLPFALWIIGAAFCLALTLFLIQLAHAKWSFSTLLGLHNASIAGVKAAAEGKPLPPMDKPIPAPKPVVTINNPPVYSPTPA